MGITRTVAGLGLGAAVAAVGAALAVAGASGSAAATVRAPLAPHAASTAAAPAATPPAATPAATPASPVDVTVTSRDQVAWTRRAEADTTTPPNHCTPVTGPDGQQLRDPAGGLVYPALTVGDGTAAGGRAQTDIAAMYAAMAAGDQQAYDAAYHALDLLVTCN